MKSSFARLLLSVSLCSSFNCFAGSAWQQVSQDAAPQKLQWQHPSQFLVYKLDEPALKSQMWNLPSDPDLATVISLPLPDGTFRNFRVWQTSLMPDELAAKYPDIKSFTGVAVDDQRVTAKLDFTLFGFDAMIFDGANTSFVDPYDNYHDGFYMVHYKRDETRAPQDRMKCLVQDDKGITPVEQMTAAGARSAAKTVNGWTKRTYRLALSANSYYCQAATGIGSPTIAQALSKMTTSMNRINGVYNRELSVQMNFCAKEDTLIWPTATGSVNGADPFYSINLNASACLTANQTQCDRRIGSANYDIGHVFTTGAGGLSLLGVVCGSGAKAQSATGSSSPVGDGFDIDYVAHEMGHEFGSEHTFNNNNDGSCGGNAVMNYAYEPGSGSTIMAYAGICGPDDLQRHSDAYFHGSSVDQIVSQLTGFENTCAVTSSTGNKLVKLSSYTTSYTIPYKTPFELIGPTAVDSVADTATTYCWEEWDLPSNFEFGNELVSTFFTGPIFRSYLPVYNSTRVFPKVSMVLSGTLSNAGIEGAEGEKVPDTARTLSFKMTVRDILNGYGCITVPDDTIHLNAVSTGATNGYSGFKVTSQGTTGISYTGGTTQTVTWNVVGTNAAPVNAANVVIYLSKDGGNTWPITLGTFPNTGSATVTIPNPGSTYTTGRIKVKGSGNVFFNVNKSNFTVTHSSSTISGIQPVVGLGSDVNVFPVPATNVLHIAVSSGNTLQAVVCNSVGQTIYNGHVTGNADIQVSTWARGIYFIRFTDTETGASTVKKFVLE